MKSVFTSPFLFPLMAFTCCLYWCWKTRWFCCLSPFHLIKLHKTFHFGRQERNCSKGIDACMNVYEVAVLIAYQFNMHVHPNHNEKRKCDQPHQPQASQAQGRKQNMLTTKKIFTWTTMNTNNGTYKDFGNEKYRTATEPQQCLRDWFFCCFGRRI